MSTYRAKQNTFLKTSPKDSTELEDFEKIAILEGQEIEVLEEDAHESNHNIYTIKSFAWPPHWEPIKEEEEFIFSEDYVNFSVPYLSQRDNEYEPHAACLRTSYAMSFAYFGVNPKLANGTQLEDELFERLKEKKQNVYLHSNFPPIAESYGIQSRFTTEGTWEEIDEHLQKGLPCIISGQFTRSGHIILLRGKDEKGYFVNDPYGEVLGRSWKYANNSGENLHYSKELCQWACEATAGKGKVWVHFLNKEEFEPKWAVRKKDVKMLRVEYNPSQGIYYELTKARRIALDLIAWCEGTDKDLDTTATGYNVMFGYETFDDFAKHPKKVIRKNGYASSAAGRYQVMDFTEDDLLAAYPNMKDFSPTYQDQRGLALIHRRNAIDFVDQLNLEGFLRACAKEWASLPYSPYGQPTKSLSAVREAFNRLRKSYQI